MNGTRVKFGALSCVLAGSLALAGAGIALADELPVAEPPAEEGLQPISGSEDLGFEYDFETDGTLTVLSSATGAAAIPAHVDGVAVTRVVAGNCGLTALDVSACAATLTELNCYGNELTSLDLSNCVELRTVQCSGNALTSIDVSNCPKMEQLQCGENQLTELDLTSCAATFVSCNSNPLTKLVQNPEVRTLRLWCSYTALSGEFAFFGSELTCMDCQIESLKVQMIPGRFGACTVFCGGNQLTSIDISESPDLQVLSCGNNQLAELDLSAVPNLGALYCSNNQLTALDLAAVPNLKGLECANNQLTELDIAGLAQLEKLVCDGNQIADISALEEWLEAEGHTGTVSPQQPAESPDQPDQPGDPDQPGGSDGPDDPAVPTVEPFTDVFVTDWYVEAGYLDFVVSRGIMSGYTDVEGNPLGLFGPNDTLTRAQVATVIYRYVTGTTADADFSGSTTFFDDVENGTWCTPGVQWCFEQGIVTGYTEADGTPTGLFGPNDPVTREQLATMVWRLADLMNKADAPGADLSAFPDASEVSDFARAALAWCNAEGIITGDLTTGIAMLVPQGDATRCQMAKIITETIGVIEG